MDKEAAARFSANLTGNTSCARDGQDHRRYFDVKSPHAYLAIRPTIEIMRDYKVHVNFVPYTLSYRTLGVSTSVEKDMKRRPNPPPLIGKHVCITPQHGIRRYKIAVQKPLSAAGFAAFPQSFLTRQTTRC